MLNRDFPLILRRSRQITHFKLALHLKGYRQPKLIEIIPPSTLIFDPRAFKDVAYEYLIARGFMRLSPRPALSREAA